MEKWLVALLAAVALAGCSSDDAPKQSAEDLCDGYLDAEGVCQAHVEPAIVLTGLPETVSAYVTTPFAWALDNGTRGLPGEPVHSMDSRIIAFTDGTVPTNATGPDVGTEIAKQEHKNLPDAFEGQFTWAMPGETVTLWGYMLIDAVNTWNELLTISVIEPPATGTVHTITIEQGPPPALAEGDNDITIFVGDAVDWDDQNAAYDYTITFDCNKGESPADVTPGTQVVFTTPAACSWVAKTPLSDQAEGTGDLSGTIRVSADA